jgi:hypothetical protein
MSDVAGWLDSSPSGGETERTLITSVATRYPNARIVLMSGFDDTECQAYSDPSQHVTFLPKPFRPQHAVDLVEELLLDVPSV